jgi:hypothetical protein
MPQAVLSNSTPAPEPPPESIVNKTLDPMGRSIDFFVRAAFTPDQIAEFTSVFVARHMIADEIERLLAVLDALDGDEDLELNINNVDPRLDDAEDDGADNEPSLAGFGTQGENSCFVDCERDDCDLEDGHDREEDLSDREPSLGWTSDGVMAGFDDREGVSNAA